MSDSTTITDSITKILDALQTAAPGFIQNAAQAERVQAITSIIVLAIATIVSAALTVFFYRKNKEDDFEVHVVVFGVVTALVTVALLTACSTGSACIASPEYCVVKELVK